MKWLHPFKSFDREQQFSQNLSKKEAKDAISNKITRAGPNVLYMYDM